MSDYSEQGAVPVEDAVVDDPPTVDEVAARQERQYPEQARTSTVHAAAPGGDEEDDEVEATVAAGGDPTWREVGRACRRASPSSPSCVGTGGRACAIRRDHRHEPLQGRGRLDRR